MASSIVGTTKPPGMHHDFVIVQLKLKTLSVLGHGTGTSELWILSICMSVFLQGNHWKCCEGGGSNIIAKREVFPCGSIIRVKEGLLGKLFWSPNLSLVHLYKCNLPLSVIDCRVELPVHCEEITIMAFIWEGIQECLVYIATIYKTFKAAILLNKHSRAWRISISLKLLKTKLSKPFPARGT